MSVPASFRLFSGPIGFVIAPITLTFDLRRRDERRRRADPLEISVVIDAHHLAASHAQERQHRREAIQPDVHDAYLDLRQSVRRLDYGRETHAFLQDVVVTARGRYRGKVGVSRLED